MEKEDARLRFRFPPRPPLEEVIREEASKAGIPLEELFGRGRTSRLATARSRVCRRAVVELACTGAEVARALRVDGATVSRFIRRR